MKTAFAQVTKKKYALIKNKKKKVNTDSAYYAGLGIRENKAPRFILVSWESECN